MAPEHAFPAALDDIIAAYQAVAAHKGGVIIGGESAGGCLAFALMAEISKLGLPKPLGCFTFSALTDLTFSGKSITENAASEVFLPADQVDQLTDLYLQGADPNDPRVSPLFAEFPECCPVWMSVGTTEILLDDSRRMAEKLRQGGTDVTLEIKKNHFHAWPFVHKFLPEARRTLSDVGDWINQLSECSTDS